MRLRITAVFILAAMSLPAANPATLGLVIRQGAAVPSGVRQHFEAETTLGVERSLKDGNLALAWRDEASFSSSESFDRLIVVAFQGDCSTAMPKSPSSSGPLGWTSTSDGRVLPFIGIDCDRVKATLMVSDAWPHSMIPAGLLGRALSHVAVHEIYHVLSGRKHHDAEGLFKAEYSAADLLSPVALRASSVAEIAGLPHQP
jgi:hypothetical protein